MQDTDDFNKYSEFGIPNNCLVCVVPSVTINFEANIKFHSHYIFLYKIIGICDIVQI